MVVGLAARAVGVLAAAFLTRTARGCASQDTKSTMADVVFCFLATMPRATIQGALGAVPDHERFFHDTGQREEAREFIFTAARLYIVCMSVTGMTLLNTFGPAMLDLTRNTRPPEESLAMGGQSDDHAELLEQLDMPGGDRSYEEELIINAAELLAEEYGMDNGAEVLELLRRGGLSENPRPPPIWTPLKTLPSTLEEPAEEDLQDPERQTTSDPPSPENAKRDRALNDSPGMFSPGMLPPRTVSEPAVSGRRGIARKERRMIEQRSEAIKRLAINNPLDPLTQFDALGPRNEETLEEMPSGSAFSSPVRPRFQTMQ
mmetsp:Transcript_34245/g.62083  ORF Transcript_34245/g.62083 Transcript_34245/m.62083 type:complete len:317 (+) Transcript_34245:2-952(+)